MDGPLNKVRENRHFMDLLHIKKVPNFVYPKMIRQCISTGAAGAQTPRSLGHHLLHPLILRLLVLPLRQKGTFFLVCCLFVYLLLS